jgi:hypothetical protein
MSSSIHTPSMTYTPNHHPSGRKTSVPHSAAQPTPLRNPPAVYLGQQVSKPVLPCLQPYEQLKREHGSISSASTDSLRRTAPSSMSDPIHIYSPGFAMSSQVEQGTQKMPQSTRSYPNQYTRPSRSEMADINAVYQQSHEEDELSETSEDHAIWVAVSLRSIVFKKTRLIGKQIWLSMLDPLYCTLAALYTLIILLPLLLLTPLHLCRSACDLSNSIVRFISPILRQHLRLLNAETAESRHDLLFKPLSLIVVYLAAPIFSLGVAIAAWVSASFWVFAIIMGNPDGTERRDDGRATVLAVRNWWERYLLWAVR